MIKSTCITGAFLLTKYTKAYNFVSAFYNKQVNFIFKTSAKSPTASLSRTV